MGRFLSQELVTNDELIAKIKNSDRILDVVNYPEKNLCFFLIEDAVIFAYGSNNPTICRQQRVPGAYWRRKIVRIAEEIKNGEIKDLEGLYSETKVGIYQQSVKLEWYL